MAEANNWSVRHWQIMIFCDNWVQMCFSIRSPSLFFNEYLWEAKWSAIFTQERSQEGEMHGFIYTWAECYLQPIYTVGRNCTWADHNLSAVICRSRGGLVANETEETFASNNKKWLFEEWNNYIFNGRFLCILFFFLVWNSTDRVTKFSRTRRPKCGQ